MMKKIACTVGSHEKNECAGLLPARERYLGSHVAHAANVSLHSGIPLYFLSGLKGLISADEPIELYDYLLEESAVDALAGKVIRRLELERITHVFFYYKPKPAWSPYFQAIKRATFAADVAIWTFMLPLVEEQQSLSPA